MLGLTTLGIFHTVISLTALVSGLVALARDKQITLENRIGKFYVVTTVLTCLTGFGIFQHGGFGKPHALGVLTLFVLAIAALAGLTRTFGRASQLVEALAYSTTVFFHLIPTVAESFTRLPPSAPLAASAEAPLVQAVTGAVAVIFAVGVAFQVRYLRGKRIN